MSCVRTNFSIEGDIENRLRKSVIRVSKGIVSFEDTLASFFKNQDFLDYLKTQIGDKTPAEANQNIVRKCLREWLRRTNPRVDLTTARVNGDTLQGFSNNRAKSLALSYTVDLLNQFDLENRNSESPTRLPNEKILNKVVNEVKNNFFNNVFKTAYAQYKENNTDNKYAEIDELSKQLAEITKFINETKKKYKGKYPKDVHAEMTAKMKEYENTLSKYKLAVMEFIANEGNVREQNFANFYTVIATDTRNWFNNAFNLKKSLNLAKKYGYTITKEDLSEYINEDEIDIEETDNEGLNEESRRYLDEIDKYKSFLQLVDSNLRQYISNLKNLKELNNEKGQYIIDTDNELGVATTMNAGFVINNIMSRCNFADGIPGLISSLEKLISNKPKLFGLYTMIERMKTDANFARSVYYGLGNPVITKTMITISDKLDFSRSNTAADPRLALTFTLMNQMKSTIADNYDIGAADTFDKLLKQFKNKNFDYIEKALLKYISNFLPGLDLATVSSYINNGNKEENLKELRTNLATINKSFETIINQMNKKKYGDINYDSVLSALTPIVDKILPYIVVNTELNSSNAQGNMSSDVMNNNAITNLIKQINYGTEQDANAGLNLLLNIIKQCPQYNNSPIFWGVHRGTEEIMPGLFYKDALGEPHVSPNAKQIIRTSLFNGITNPNTGENTLYSIMSKADYFVSSLIAFNNSYKDHNNPKLDFLSGGYFMRVPSDAPKNFIIHAPKISTIGLIKNGAIDRNHGIYLAYKQVLRGEIETFIHNLNNIFEKNKDGEWVLKKDKRGLFGNYHFKGDFIKDGKLTGQVFKFLKLHQTTNVNVNKMIEDLLSIYGGANSALISKSGKLNLTRTDIIKVDNTGIHLANNFDINFKDTIDTFMDNYLTDLIKDILIKKQQFADIIGDKFEDSQIIDMALNTNLMYANFDDLFEGDAKFYKDAQTFLKRAKEVQAGGMTYDNWNCGDDLNTGIKNITENNKPITYTIAGRTINARNGFRAITINNSIRPSDEAKNIEANLRKQGVNEDTIKDIVSRFAGDTTINDAQSYITIDELANRLFAKGQLDAYKPLLNKFLAKDENSNPLPINEEDLKALAQLGEKIQVQKNFYFDKQFDANTKTMYPRQIKNAEFVLIPQLLPENSSLRTLYNMMTKYDIGQVNTAETDKAAKRYILDFWDNDGFVSDKALANFELELTNGAAIENYYYRYLYEQQQVAQHMEEEQNKAGIQIMKKIIDNAGNYSTNVQNAVKSLFDNYVGNIEDSFNTMMDDMGWKIDVNGNIVDKKTKEILNFTEFYKRGREEAKRLGLDSQFLAYFEVDEKGNAILPNFMNNIQTKFESIAQSMFNSAVTRQKLPGWHAAQITNVGFDKKLDYHKDGSAIAQIRLTPWFNMNVFAGKSNEEILTELHELGLDKMIIYRIPTEGKQSISVAEVTELLDRTQGSTVVVPDEWVTQTGSDFDVDSVYGIQFTFKRNKETGKLELETEGRAGRNNAILKAMIDIMSDPTVMEENLSCSNFDEIGDNIKFFNEINPEIKSAGQSTYDIFDQMIFMENATSGMALKAASVVRDNFNSINSYVKSDINPERAIRVEYNLNEFDLQTIQNAYDNVDTTSKPGYAIVTHNRLANSKNNRNVKGRLITVYSSQTTAHILDAIKTGAIFNENQFTFGAFKTLIDLGIDYKTTIAFLQQPAMTMIVNHYNRNKSVYSENNNYSTKPIHDTIRELAQIAGIKIGGKLIDERTPLDVIRKALVGNSDIQNAYKKLFGASLSFDKNVKHNYIALNADVLIRRLKSGKLSTTENNPNIKDLYGTIAYDLGMTMFFDNLNYLTKGIEMNARVSNPDKFGAKQTVATTRDKINDIRTILNDSHNPAYSLISVNGTPLMEAIYPGIDDAIRKGNNPAYIRVKDSKYPYLAAFIKYATLPSINVNSQLFYLENNDIHALFNNIQTAVGKKLNENQQKEYKQYLVSMIYNNVVPLIQPMTIDNTGHIILDEEIIREQEAENTPQYWNLERNRIFGYRVLESYNFPITNIYSPTTEEFKKFRLLTPSQKIDFIKKHFHADAGIFAYLETNNYKGETTIKYKDVSDDIESLYKLMNEAFFNTNPLIRLTTLDLIKYAYLVEGGKFKKGSIGKLVTKEILLASSNNYGINLKQELMNAYDNLRNFGSEIRYEVKDRFIRSHKEIVDNINITKANPLSKYYKGNIYIVTKGDQECIQFIKWFENNPREYIRLTKTIMNEYGQKVTQTRLYKIEEGYGDSIIMYPLNTLNANETTEYSNDIINNPRISSPKYFQLVYETGKTKPSEIIESIQEQVAIDEFVVKNNKITKLNSNENLLSEKLESNSPVEKQQADNIVADITDIVRSPVKGTFQGLIISNAYWFNNSVPKGRGLQQKLIIDGKPITVAIKRVNNKRLANALKQPNPFATEIYNSLSINEQNLLQKAVKSGLTNPSLYGVAIMKDSEVRANTNAEARGERMASSKEYVATDNTIKQTTPLEDVTDLMLKDIAHFERISPNQLSENFLRDIRNAGIDINSMASISGNIKPLLIKAAFYYAKHAAMLAKHADKFMLSNGVEYSIDDPELYNNLSVEEDLDVLGKLLMDMKTFGNSIKEIMKLEPQVNDPEVKRAINSIITTINQVTSNPKMLKGFELIFNKYYKKYSNNPMIRQGIIELRESYGDISRADMLIASIHEIDNNQVQTVVKYIDNRLRRIERIDIPKARKAFAERYAQIEEMPGDIDWNKIVDENGYLYRQYSDEFFAKRAELSEKVRNATPNTLEYHKAKLERDTWLAKNVYRSIDKSYYDAINTMTSIVLNTAPDLYVKYMELNERLLNLNRDVTIDTQDKINARRNLLNEMAQLYSVYDENLNKKTGAEYTKAKALSDFLKKKQELNRKVFTRVATEEFNEQLDYHTKVIAEYDIKYPNRPLNVKLGDENYTNSYNWIQSNTLKQLNETSRKAIQEAFAAIRKDAEEVPNFVKHILKGKDVYDEKGNLDPIKISLEDARAIKEAKEKQFSENDFEPALKNVPKDKPIFKQAYWDMVKHLSDESGADYQDIIHGINTILKKVCETGADITINNLEKLSDEDLKELGELYWYLNHPSGGNKDLGKFIKENSKIAYNTSAYQQELGVFLSKYKGTKSTRKNLMMKILFARNKDGMYERNDDGTFKPNAKIFGYRIPKDQFRNKKLEDARKLINDNVQWETTEAYRQAEDEAEASGTYKEWFDANHYYNPYSGEFVPLPYWTKMTINPNGTLDASYEQVPTNDNLKSVVNDSYKNSEFNSNSSINYNATTGQYNNPIKLNAKEQAMVDLFQSVLDNNASNSQMKYLADKGFMPRQAKVDTDTKWWAQQVLGGLGMGISTRQPDWSHDINYDTEEQPAPPMLQYLKAKGYMPMPKRDTFATEDEYNTEVEKVKENNKAIDRALMDRDFKSVMDLYIQKAMLYNEKNILRTQAHMLIQDLKDNSSYSTNYLGSGLSKKGNNKVDASIDYNTETNERTIKLLENWYHRVFRDEFKTRNKYNSFGSFMQNMTSAKYMIFNVTGGIANLTTGRINILGEQLAGEYFDGDTWRKAAADYAAHSLEMIANQYKSESSSLTEALIKLGDVVDFDAIIERAGNNGLAKMAERVRDKMYFMQSTGEHIMQNTVFLAMLNSHRLYQESGTGKWIAGSFEQFVLNKEQNIFYEMIQNDTNMLNQYNNFIENIRNDANKRYLYTTYKRNMINDFIKEFGGKELQKKYNQYRTEARKRYKEEFNALETVYDQFILVDGFAQTKAGTKLTDNEWINLINKTISVNQRIHGVYDKIGAAYIERWWLGTLIMQYHKHIYPLFKKLYRKRGYYNEIRGTIEKGAYQSAWNLSTQSFKDAAESNAEIDNIVKRSIFNIIEGTYNTIMDFQFNYQSMSDWEKANCRRALAWHIGVLASILAATLLHAGWDDDDFKESNTLATGLYLCDRLYTESFELHPIGLPSALQTIWSSPVASVNTITDTRRAIEILNGMLFDDEFEWDYTTGRYKGQNKLATLVGRQIPIYRIYDRLSGMAKSNKYYRIGKNNWAMKTAKNLGNTIQGEE